MDCPAALPTPNLPPTPSPMKRIALLLLLPLTLLLAATPGCLHITTHSTIDPVHITLDVNLKVKLERELADAFGDIDAASTTVN